MGMMERFPLNPAITFRENQIDGVDALMAYWAAGGGHPVLDIATGGGKSITIGEICRRILNVAPLTRIGVLTLSQELVEQDYKDIKFVCPKIPAGIVMASLNKKQFDKQVIVGSIQTLYTSLGKTGGFHVILVDEGHTVALLGKPDPETGEIPEDTTMFGKFIDANAKIVPNYRMCALTATPWRDNNLPIFGWERGRFTEVIYRYSIGQAIEKGYLVPPINEIQAERISTAGVKVSSQTGDYIEKQLAKKIENDDAVNIPAVAKTIEALETRNSAVVFCVSIQHAYNVQKMFHEAGVDAEVVHGNSGAHKMTNGKRRSIIKRFRAGKFRVLINCLVLLIGFDHKALDLITVLRPTKSSAAWLQLIGRGLRCCEETGKTNCLVLDYTENTEYFGPIDLITAPKPPKPKVRESEVGNIKECPSCKELIPLTARKCPAEGCDHEFVSFSEPTGPDIRDEASQAQLLSTQAVPDRLFRCTGWLTGPHQKLGKPTSMRVDYLDGMRTRASDWICFSHSGAPRSRATRWWHIHGGQQPAPNTTEEALSRIHELQTPSAITCRKDGKWEKVVGQRFGNVIDEDL